MQLTNEFRVDASPATTWSVLTDLERIAPCMPGAQLQEVAGEEHRGIVKVKVGPITAQYKGTARFAERDETARRAVVRAEGREARGQGTASATITATLEPDGDGTRVTVLTDLHITGKVAQFGRGVIADVSNDLLAKFVKSLEATVLQDDAAPDDDARADATGGQPTVRRVDQPEPEPIDLANAVAPAVARRVAPLATLVAAAWIVLLLVRRHRKKS